METTTPHTTGDPQPTAMSPGKWVSLVIGTLSMLFTGSMLVQSYSARGITCGSVITADRPSDPTAALVGLSGGAGDVGSMFAGVGAEYEAAVEECDSQRMTRIIWAFLGLVVGAGAFILTAGRPGSSARTSPFPTVGQPDLGPRSPDTAPGWEPDPAARPATFGGLPTAPPTATSDQWARPSGTDASPNDPPERRDG